jgi:predicted transcriptional regulator
MGRRKSATFTEVELEFMQVIWAAGEVSTDHVQEVLKERGRNLSDGSIRKILSILIEKGHLTRRRDGRAFLYKSKVREGQAHRKMVQDLVKRAFGGSAGLMVAALFDGNAPNERDLKDIKRLIEKHEKGGEQ